MASQPARSLLQPKTVLLADADPQVRDVYASYLRFRGYEASVADSAEAAMEVARRTPPDLVVVDPWRLPGAGSLVHTLRSSRETEHVPIVAVTANGSPYARETAVRSGCTAFFPKPMSAWDLGEEVTRLIGPARQRPAG